MFDQGACFFQIPIFDLAMSDAACPPIYAFDSCSCGARTFFFNLQENFRFVRFLLRQAQLSSLSPTGAARDLPSTAFCCTFLLKCAAHETDRAFSILAPPASLRVQGIVCFQVLTPFPPLLLSSLFIPCLAKKNRIVPSQQRANRVIPYLCLSFTALDFFLLHDFPPLFLGCFVLIFS